MAQTAGPGDQTASPAGGHGRLRASHAARKRVIDMLKAAFVQGRLDQDEFETRVGRTLAARTYLELAASLVSGGNSAERLTLVAALIPMMALMITGWSGPARKDEEHRPFPNWLRQRVETII